MANKSATRIDGENGVIIGGAKFLELPKSSTQMEGELREGMIRFRKREGATDPQDSSIEVCVIPETISGSGSADPVWRRVALLDENGKFNSTLLPAGLDGSLRYRGSWDPTTEPSSTLVNNSSSPARASGDYYIVSKTASSVTDDAGVLVAGETPYNVGHWIVWNGTQWAKVSNSLTTTTSSQVSVEWLTETVPVAPEASVRRRMFDDIGNVTDDTQNSTTDVQDALLKLIHNTIDRKNNDVKWNNLIFADGNVQMGYTGNANGRILINKGSVASPAIQFREDTNTGLYWSTNDRIGFATAGTMAAEIDQIGVTTKAIMLDDGTSSLPAIRWEGRTGDSGIYRSGDSIRFSINNYSSAESAINKQTVIITNNGVITDKFYARSNSVSVPSYTFDEDTDTGFTSSAANKVELVTAGAARLDVDTSRIVANLQLRAINGTQALPAYSFINNPDTGIYYDTSVRFGFDNNQIFNYNASVIQALKPIQSINGTKTGSTWSLLPYSFTASTNSGLGYDGDNVVLIDDGVEVVRVRSDHVEVTQPLHITEASTAATPGFRVGSENTGINYPSDGTYQRVVINGNEVMEFNNTKIIANRPLNADKIMSDDSNTYIEFINGEIRHTVSSTTVMNEYIDRIEFKKPLWAPNGSNADPMYSFTSDTGQDSGMFSSGDGNVDFSANSVHALKITSAYVNPKVRVQANKFTTALPTYSFFGDTSTGINSGATSQLNLITAGVERIRIDNAQTLFYTDVKNMGDITLSNASGTASGEIIFSKNTDYSKIGFKNTADSDTDAYMYFATGDNGNEYFKFQAYNSTTPTTLLDIKPAGITVSGTNSTLGQFNFNVDSFNYSGRTITRTSSTVLTINPDDEYASVVISGGVCTIDRPQTSRAPTDNADLANKLYIDQQIAAVNANIVKDNTAETVTAKWTFSVLPESNIAPTTNLQFANKKYVDDRDLLLSNRIGTLETAFPTLTTKTYVDGQISAVNANIVKDNTTETITAKWTYNTLPESAVVPTTNNQLVNKKYVNDQDAVLSGRIDALESGTGTTASKTYVDQQIANVNANIVKDNTTETVTAKWTFNVLPESGVTPTTNNQLVNKVYVDTANGALGLRVTNLEGAITSKANTSYVDTQISTNMNNVAKTNRAETITSVWTYNTLPSSTVVPTTNNQLVNKKYVDDVKTALEGQITSAGSSLWEDSGVELKPKLGYHVVASTDLMGFMPATHDNSHLGLASRRFGQANIKTISCVDLFASGNVRAFSDERLKSDIVKIEGALDKVVQISGYTYIKDIDGTKVLEAGVLAQEIEKVLPEVVDESPSGYKTVQYGNLSALLIEAVKEEKAKREALEDEVAELKALVQKLLNK